MNELEEKRKQQNELEKNQIKLIYRYLEQQRKNFEYSDLAYSILETKNETDLIFIAEKINEWHDKAKAENKKQFLEIILALFRVQSYCVSIQTIAKGSVAELSDEIKRVKELESKLRTLEIEKINIQAKHEREIKSLKQEIEFITNNK
ncbi:hypothetical protein [Flavobacterium phage FCOV-F18]|uniref:Uncharacterized protein n=10 Tax=Ficleduovirus FCV1 TaxID=2560474 RepID=A0A218M8N0_9CAUD|nr:hypothetical protein FDG55_gp58 [Flavobacterium phage FCV-1]ASD51640.1 hypothetical protein [Flavobacterium phage FCV-3]ASD51714.1 hypothetical protein [Flavobacterium phage FCV-11]ASD51788.1 hypothetical protein [Flavobacterium phage V175]ASD51866.1 hypothetical protein [Flavobacterium phage V181]ASD52544.1 hypothetical protein [Flavobacterium phage FCV-10]ASD52617.1 hypothetical protein [Flavobacterium phage FCV-16]ASD52691.1 hypothetical protein [Flavobacterium phage FCV-20]ASD52921.1